jgi:hypothetical protein
MRATQFIKGVAEAGRKKDETDYEAMGTGAGLVGLIPGGLVLWAGGSLVAAAGVTSLGAALALWAMWSSNKKKLNSPYEGNNFSVFINGKKTKSNLEYNDAVSEIKRLASIEHDPNTYYTIVDNNLNKILWRFKVGDPLDEQKKKAVAEGNYDRDDYYNARQGREYGRDMTATGWGGDGSKTRRDDIFKGQSKRLPADPFARTSGAVPTAGTGRIHSNALPGEMDEANDQKIGGRHDADEFDDMVSRLKKLAGAGPMKTVYDPDRRVYRNMPTAQQPAQQPKKATR